jgi:methionyl-tRNA formyltransferase
VTSADRIERVVFLGTPDESVVALRALADAGFDIASVLTQPDRRRGRGSKVVPSPVKRAALELGLPVAGEVAELTGLGADLGVVVAYGRIIPASVLDRLPMVNIHFSLLPRWRGAAPVERAILAGDERTGVDLMVVEEGLDTGAVYDRREVTIGPDETADELRTRLAAIGADMLVRNLGRGLGDPRQQEGEPTYARKITVDELAIDWQAPAVDVHRRVRVGGAWTTHDGHRLKIWRTALPGSSVEGVDVPAADGTIRLVEVQPEGRRRMPAAAWANGVGGDPVAGLGR